MEHVHKDQNCANEGMPVLNFYFIQLVTHYLLLLLLLLFICFVSVKIKLLAFET